MRKYIFISILLLIPFLGKSQFSLNSGLEDINYSNPQEYEIGGITIAGINYFNPSTIKAISGLAVGDKVTVPGDKITSAIKKLWEQKLFSEIVHRSRKNNRLSTEPAHGLL